MTPLEIILSCVTALFGGGNILQLFVMRSIKRKSNEEANQASSESWRLIVDGNVREIKRLQERLDYYEQKYTELLNEVNELKKRLAYDEATNNTDGVFGVMGVRKPKKRTHSAKQRHSQDNNGQPADEDGQRYNIPLA